MMNLKIALLTILAAGAPANLSPPADEVLQPYIGELDGAIKSAQERNVPVLIHVVQEGEEANDRYRGTVLKDQDLVKRSKMAVVVVVNDGSHDKRTIKIKRGEEVVTKKVCEHFFTPSCNDHKENWDRIFRRFNVEGEMKTPQALVLNPTGELAERIYAGGDIPAISSFQTALKAVEKKIGPGLTLEQLVSIKRLSGEARSRENVKDWGGAWRKWSAVLAIQAKGKFATEAQDRQPAALTKLEEEVEAARKLCAEGTACQGYRQLVALVESCRETPLEKPIAKHVKAVERDKSIKDAIKRCKVELDAESLWDDAQEQFRAGKEKKGLALIKKLLKKKYDETPIVQRAREIYADLWAKEEARRNKKKK